MMQGLKKAIILSALLGLAFVQGWSYYFADPFTNANNWQLNLKYNLRLGVWAGHIATGAGGKESWDVAGNQMTFSGAPVDVYANYSSEFYGIYSLFTNTNYTGTPQNPFGFEITRTYIRNDSGNVAYRCHMFNICMVESSPLVVNYPDVRSPLYDSGPNFPNTLAVSDVYFRNKNINSFMTWNQTGFTNTTSMVNTWTSLTDEAGGTANISNLFNVNYSTTTNSNSITFRLVNDGSRVAVYVNPNGSGGSSRAFYYAGEFPVAFNTNLVPLIGLASLSYDDQGTSQPATFNDIRLSNFIIRSICSNAVSEMAPSSLKAGTNSPLFFSIDPTFSTANEAGVGEFLVDLPSGYSWTNANFTNSIGVYFATNGVKWKSFGRVYGPDAHPSTAGNINITIKHIAGTDYRRLKVRFNTNDYFHPDNLGGLAAANSNTILLVVTNFTTLPAANANGINFSIWLNNEKYPDTYWPKWATTGRILSYEGNAGNMILVSSTLDDQNALTLKTFDNQAGVASVTPLLMYEAQQKTFFYDVQGINPSGNNVDISRIEIFVSTNFSIDTNTLDNDRGLSNNQLYVSNVIVNGSNVIRVDYPAGGGLAATGGRDTIRFNILNTPTVPTGQSELTNYWPSVSYSTLSGTAPTNNITNALFPSQMVIVRKKPPDALASITAWTNGSTNILNVANTATSNFLSFILNNNGNDKNDIKKVRIKLASQFTNARTIKSTIASTNLTFSSNGNVFVDIFYTNNGLLGVTTGTKSNDLISMTVFDTIPALTNMVIIASNYILVDNLNGDGFTNAVNLSTNLNHWDLFYYTPPASAKGYLDTPYGEDGNIGVHNVYVDQGGTNLSVIITNTGETGNTISSVKIYLPTDFTNITAVNSWSNGVEIITNNGLTNVVLVNYTNMGGLQPNTIDRIDIGYLDQITVAKTVAVQFETANTSNYTANYGTAPALKSLNVDAIYAPAMAVGYVDVPKGFISASSPNYVITNLINNSGRQRNYINYAEINFPPALITNVTAVTSLLLASNTYNNVTGKLSLYYTNGIFPGQTTDVIGMTVWHINTNTNFNLTYSVSNNRWMTNNLPAAPGYLQTVAIADFPILFSHSVYPTLFYNKGTVTTNQLQVVVSNRGWGNNNLNQVRIQPPSLFSGKIISVSNAFMQLTNTASGPVKISNSIDIWINYTNNNTTLVPDQVDTNFITFVIDMTNVTNLYWNVGAVNNHATVVTNLKVLLAGTTNMTTLVKKPYGFITPSQVLTTTIYNTYNYRISDDGMNAGRSIKKVRIAMTDDYNQLVNFSSTIPFTTFTNYTGTGSNYIEATYANGVGPGGDNIQFVGYDTISAETTNFSSLQVDYNDGLGWRPTIISNGTNMIIFKRPDVKGSTFVTPATVYQDFPTNAFSFFIQNDGEVGNNIQMVKIIAPGYITNCSMVTSMVLNAPVLVSGGAGIITNILFYTNSYTLSNSMTDWISMIGYNNYPSTTVTNGVWTILANNTTNSANDTNINVITGQSLSNFVIQPGYAAEIGISVTNSVSGGFGTNIYTTLITNFLEFDVFNQSSPGTWLNSLRIKIPSVGVLLNTNGIKVSNLLKTGVTNYISNDYIVVDYYSNQVRSQEMDQIMITVNDAVVNINTNLTWSADASFNTTYNRYKPATLYAGDTLSVSYVMPAAHLNLNAQPLSTSEDFPTNTYQITVTNIGTEPNNVIYSLRLSLPDAITNISQITNLNPSNSVVFSQGSNFLTIHYTNNGYTKPLEMGSWDTIQFIGWDRVTNAPYASNWTMTAANTTNGTLYQNAGLISGGNQTLNIIRYPYSAKVYMEATNSTSIYEMNQLYSTVTTNYLMLYMTNTSSGTGNSLIKASIGIPWVVNTNSLSLSSLNKGAGLSWNTISNTLLLDYSSSNILKSDYDKVLIAFVDKVKDGYTNAHWTNVQVAYDTTYSQLKPATLWQGRSLSFDYTMPAPAAQAYSYPDIVSQDFPTNGFSLFITNAAQEPENTIYALRIMLPAAITNVTGLTHLNGAYNPVFATSSTSILVMYTNSAFSNGLKPGGYDTIQFTAHSALNGSSPDYFSNWTILADNSTVLTNSKQAAWISNGLGLSIIRYPYAAVVNMEATNFAYVYDKYTLYSTTPTNYLVFAITNVSAAVSNDVTLVKITIPPIVDTNSLRVTNIIQTAGVSNYISNNYIILDYRVSNLNAGEYDSVMIKYVPKTLNLNTNATWTTEAAFNSTYNVYKATGGVVALNYVMPAVSLAGYTTPNRVSQDFPTNAYRLVLTNTASEEGNAVYKVRINIPGPITNLTALSNLVTNATLVYTQASNTITVYYTNMNYTKGLLPGASDTIDFVGADNITAATYSSNWLVSGDNTTNNTGMVLAGTYNGGSFALVITNYAYALRAYIEAANSVSPANKNAVYSTITTNFVMLILSNVSGSNENRMTSARITVPWVVDTNTLIVSNLTRPNVTATLASNFVYLDYASSNMLLGEGDQIMLQYNDKVMNINTNAVYTVDAAYNTTYGLYKSAALWPGKSLTLGYVMPAASALAYSTPNRISIDYPMTNYSIFITNNSTNTGNNLFVVQVGIPKALTNLINLTNLVTNSKMVYNQGSGTLTVYYTNNNYSQGLIPGAYDIYQFKAFNSNSQPFYGNWSMTVDNTTNGNGVQSAGIYGGSAFDLIITNFAYSAYAYIEATNSEDIFNPNNIYSTVITNYLKLYLTNSSGSNENRLVTARIALPWTVLTNTLLVSNLNRPNVTAQITNNTVVLDYSSSNLLQGESDIILLQYADKVWNVSTNASFSLDAVYNTSYGLYKPVSVWPGSKLLTLTYDMPSVNARAYTAPNTVSHDFPSNSFTLYVTNQAQEQGNGIYLIQVSVPNFITNITGLTNANTLNTYRSVFATNILSIYFTNNGYTSPFKESSDDIFSFTAHQIVTNVNFNTNWILKAYNTTNASQPSTLSALSGYSLALNNIQYPYLAKAYLEATNSISVFARNTIYSTLTTDYLRFVITNNSAASGNNITSVRLKIPGLIVTNTIQVSNLIFTAGSAYSISNGYLVLDYSVSNIQQNQGDVVMIQFNDQVLNTNLTLHWTNVGVAYNTTYNSYKPVTLWSGKSLSFDYVMPPMRAYAWASTNLMSQDFPSNNFVLYITNTGFEAQNNLYRVRVNVPDGITNITSLTRQNTNYNPIVSYSGNIINVYYTNGAFTNGLRTGDFDALQFMGVSKFRGGDADYYSNWVVYADNSTDGSGLGSVTELYNGLSLGIIRYPYQGFATVMTTNSLTNIYSTVPTNYITLSITNTSAESGNNINAVRVKIPGPAVLINTNTLSVSNLVRTTGVSYSISNTYIVFDYTASNIKPGEYDTVLLQFVPKTMNLSTNVSWPVEMAFDSGFNIYKPALGSWSFTYSMPQANGFAYAAPNAISEDYPSKLFTLMVTNSASEVDIDGNSAGNNINIVRINLPAQITNISGLTNLNGAYQPTLVYVSNKLYAYYTNQTYTAGLKEGDYDLYEFTGYFTQVTNDIASTWPVFVDNSTNGAGERSALALTNNALSFTLKQYPSIIYADISSTVPVDVTNYNAVYSTVTTNNLILRIDNESAGDNNVKYVQVTIPGGTNFYDAASLVLPANASNAVSNSDILFWLDYTTNMIQPGTVMNIPVQVNDLLIHSETNVNWGVQVLMDKNYPVYKGTTAGAGRSQKMSFVMPKPTVAFTMQPTEIYLARTNFALQIQLSNTGTGTADVDQLSLTLPADLQILSLTNSIVNSTITLTTNTNGSVTAGVTYAAGSLFQPGLTDSFTLQLNQTATNAKTTALTTSVRGFIKTNDTTGAKSMLISTVPMLSISPTSNSTTLDYGDYQVMLDNGVSGTKAIKDVIIELPDVITNYSLVSSLIPSVRQFVAGITNISGVDYSNVLLVSYPSNNGILQSQKDVIEMNFYDNLALGNLTTGIKGWVKDSYGYVPMGRINGQSTNMVYVMPDAIAYSDLYSDKISLTSTTNIMSLSLTNKGFGSSGITYALLTLPSGIGDVNTIISAKGAVSSYVTNSFTNYILFDYTTNFLKATEADTIQFSYSNRVNVVTNMLLNMAVANLTNSPKYVVSPGRFGNNLILQVSYPQLAAEAYFYSDNKLYQMDSNQTMTYRIVNRTFNTELTQAVVTLDPYLFSNPSNTIAVTNNRAGSQLALNSNIITISYQTNYGLSYTEVDDLILDFVYTFSNVMTNLPVSTRVWVFGDTNDSVNTLTTGSYVSEITITNLNWGALAGTIYPTNKQADVSLFYPGSQVKATNGFGTTLVGNAKNGSFAIGKIIPGNYDVEFYAPYYRKLRIPNISIDSNLVTTMSVVTMRNALLVGSYAQAQEVGCYQNTNTKIVFPANALDSAFSIDITRVPLTTEQVGAIGKSQIINIPSDTSGMMGYKFAINNDSDASMVGKLIQLDAVLYLGYDPTVDVTSRGWNEGDLAIYYWDAFEKLPHWVRIGGTVDKTSKVVVAKVSYVHNNYAVMSKKDRDKDTGLIRNVEVRPKVFTPTKDEQGYFGNVRITFDFQNPVDQYTVKIYDIHGNMLRSYEKTGGGLAQGEIAWDAKDGEGYSVKSGVYIYRVVAGGVVYAGTVVIAR